MNKKVLSLANKKVTKSYYNIIYIRMYKNTSYFLLLIFGAMGGEDRRGFLDFCVGCQALLTPLVPIPLVLNQ